MLNDNLNVARQRLIQVILFWDTKISLNTFNNHHFPFTQNENFIIISRIHPRILINRRHNENCLSTYRSVYYTQFFLTFFDFYGIILYIIAKLKGQTRQKMGTQSLGA